MIISDFKSQWIKEVTGITGYLLSGWQIVVIIGGILVVFIVSRTMLRLKEK